MRPREATDPIAQFMQEHDITLHQLQRLKKAANGLAENGYTQEHFDHIVAALDFINEEVEHHNKREEEALFPILERYVEGPTQVMRNDHQELYKQFKALQKAVEKVERNAKSEKAVEELAAVGKAVVQTFVNHIHKENYILFPLVQRFLSKQELREVAKKMV